MSNIKISELTEATEANENDLLMIIQNGENKKIKASKVGTGQAGGGDTLPIGAILPFSSDTVPNGWLLCDGRIVEQADYPELFEVIGTTYGYYSRTDFKLPDLRGRVAVGKNTVIDTETPDTDFNELGKTGGEKEHTLTIDEMPSHKHGFQANNDFHAQSGTDAWIFKGGRNDGFILETGGSQPHNNLQPYLVTNFIIKAKMTVAIEGEIIQEDGTASTDNVYSASAMDKKLSKSAIVVGYSRHTQSVTSWTNTLITDASVKTQIGNKLTFSNNKVVIGEGVSHIRISAKSSFKKTVSGDCSINVKKNGELIEILDTYESIPANNWYNTAIAPSIIEVSQGDEISLHITLGNSGDIEFLASSYMTIEEV